MAIFLKKMQFIFCLWSKLFFLLKQFLSLFSILDFALFKTDCRFSASRNQGQARRHTRDYCSSQHLPLPLPHHRNLHHHHLRVNLATSTQSPDAVLIVDRLSSALSAGVDYSGRRKWWDCPRSHLHDCRKPSRASHALSRALTGLDLLVVAR